MNDIILSTQNIIRSFPVAGKTLTVLKGINVELPKGKLIIIKGRSGSGKTTLLNILSALDPATEGEVIFRARKREKGKKKRKSADKEPVEKSANPSADKDPAKGKENPFSDKNPAEEKENPSAAEERKNFTDSPVSSEEGVITGVDEAESLFTVNREDYEEIRYSTLSDSARDKLRRNHMGFVFQSVALVPIMTAYENVDFGLRTAGYSKASDAKFRDERIRESLTLVGLEERMKHMPSQMSGGEQQRVAIARAVSHRPEIIFADEPTGALDTAAGLTVTQLFKDLAHKQGITIVMTTHDAGLMELGDVVYEIEDGEITRT